MYILWILNNKVSFNSKFKERKMRKILIKLESSFFEEKIKDLNLIKQNKIKERNFKVIIVFV